MSSIEAVSFPRAVAVRADLAVRAHAKDAPIAGHPRNRACEVIAVLIGDPGRELLGSAQVDQGGRLRGDGDRCGTRFLGLALGVAGGEREERQEDEHDANAGVPRAVGAPSLPEGASPVPHVQVLR